MNNIKTINMSLEELISFVNEKQNKALEIANGCQIAIIVKDIDKDVLEAFAKETKTRFYEPSPYSPHYWVMIINGNVTITVQTKDYEVQTTWKQ